MNLKPCNFPCIFVEFFPKIMEKFLFCVFFKSDFLIHLKKNTQSKRNHTHTHSNSSGKNIEAFVDF